MTLAVNESQAPAFKAIGVCAAVALVGTVVAANWVIARFGFVPVGFGLVAPAGVWFAGLAFVLRDVVHETLGRLAVLVCIAAGALLSLVVSPAFAVASASAFALAELLDFGVYDQLRARNLLVAAAASNLVGSVVDSVVFLWLAFGSLDHLAGQIAGKLWIGAVGAVASAVILDRTVRRRVVTA
jgi:uncharacterized PurR-regulated membrane protein YhhQ (DUF165 family)